MFPNCQAAKMEHQGGEHHMRMLNNKAGYKEIASVINRSEEAVKSKAYEMGWTKHSRR